jgi:hypothetical protein
MPAGSHGNGEVVGGALPAAATARVHGSTARESKPPKQTTDSHQSKPRAKTNHMKSGFFNGLAI